MSSQLYKIKISLVDSQLLLIVLKGTFSMHMQTEQSIPTTYLLTPIPLKFSMFCRIVTLFWHDFKCDELRNVRDLKINLFGFYVDCFLAC